MNANELADLLDAVEEPDIRRAVAMLRQQQAEIDNLTSIKYVNGVTISKLYAEIEALKTKLNKYHLKEDLDRNLNLIYGNAQEK